MRNLVLFFIAFNAFANDFTVRSFRSNVDVSNLKAKEEKHKQKSNYLSAKDRDKYLHYYFLNEIKDWDHYKKELLYRKILHYPYDKVLTQYKFIKKKDLISLEKTLRELEIHQPHYNRKIFGLR